MLYFTIIETVGKNGPLPLEVTNFLFDGDDKLARLEQHGRDAVLKGAVAVGEAKDEEQTGKGEKQEMAGEEHRLENVRPS